ncbi:MAG TPA: hypothetical protein EYP88_05680 [Anaerolineales bacterium]|nr:hypothetical protein [Anaerolineales bacterium]
MDVIREQFEKPIVAGVVFFIIGLFVGLVILGWWLWPVQWTDAGPADLRADAQEDYLRMAIDSYALTADGESAQRRYGELGESASDVLATVNADPTYQEPGWITSYQHVVEAPDAAAPDGEAAVEEGGSSVTLLLVMCLITVVLAGALAVYFLMRQKSSGSVSAAAQAQAFTEQVERTDYEAMGATAPTVQFMTTYMQGDDLFDDSFSIDSPAGEFLGECGVGISETIGVGEPKKVTAFEVWIFDKNDIQTVTTVLMSEHAFLDEAIRQRLAAKGEPFKADPGAETVLETATLKLVARVADMAYGSGAMPANSYFDRITLELSVWQKA